MLQHNFYESYYLNFKIFQCVKGKPFVIFTLKGNNPDLPSLMLYSHTDVVPTFPVFFDVFYNNFYKTVQEYWTYPPYSAHKDEQGNIFARGAQDMKCVGIQYVEAFRILKETGKANFLRTIYFIWGPGLI